LTEVRKLIKYWMIPMLSSTLRLSIECMNMFDVHTKK